MSGTLKYLCAAMLAGMFSAQSMAVETVPTTPTTPTTPTPPAATPVAMTHKCPLGGTRTVTGSYDAKTGALSVETKLDKCALNKKKTIDGTDSTKGTLLLAAGVWTIDLTSIAKTTLTQVGVGTLKRDCTLTKKGTYTEATKIFDGTETRTNCSTAGQIREPDDLVEHLLRHATRAEGDDDDERSPITALVPASPNGNPRGEKD